MINADYFASIEKIETNSKAPKFKVNGRVRITKYKNKSGSFLNLLNYFLHLSLLACNMKNQIGVISLCIL